MTTPEFLGMENESYENTQVIILPIAYEGTVSYGRGTSQGPREILIASGQVELYDEELDCEFYKQGIWTEEIVEAEQSPEKMGEVVYTLAEKHIDAGKFVFMLGGEHSITASVVKACKEKFPELSVLQIDAHADLREEYDGTKHSHASVMSRVREMCPAVQVGIRSLSSEEAEKIKKKNYPVFFAKDIVNNADDSWMDKAIEQLSDDIYLTLDVDALDPSIMPATGTPEPGGLDWYTTLKFLRKIFEKKNVVACDVVELAPIDNLHAPNFLTARLVYKMIGYKFKKN